MASWMILVQRPIEPLKGPHDPRIKRWLANDSPAATELEHWTEPAAGSFAWADSLVERGRASCHGDGYPLLYAAQADDIAAGTNRPSLVGDADHKEWLILEAWDQDY